jgi:mannose-6-phosphate isomerase class I
MNAASNYDLHPFVQVTENASLCAEGWDAVLDRVRMCAQTNKSSTVVLECYPGVVPAPIISRLRAAFPQATIAEAAAAYKSSAALLEMLHTSLTDDPVFAVMRPWTIEEYFDAEAFAGLRARLSVAAGLTLVVGTGASQVAPQADCLLHLGVTRWELQGRQRRGEIGNLGLANEGASPAELYKNAYFVDWRIGDALRHAIYPRIDLFLDLDDQENPRMLAGDTLRSAIEACVRRPFRVEPFFDPGPWGGHWMQERFGLPDGPPNYAWGFDCVPEENAVALGFGSGLGAKRFRLPAIVLVHEQPNALLGDCVYRNFGAEFPIRFDLLDTVGGGNLSLQVHPLTSYMRERFGMAYTQDESYYMLDSMEGAQMYLGLRSGVDPAAMRAALESAQSGENDFPAEAYANVLPTRRHDHFAIPAGTVHCSGAGNVVLEISATPYIFTFKLWDWARLGMNGKPRPIHLEHGLANIRWERDTEWVQHELQNQVMPVAQGDGWREERTGLHALEFIETRRTWFTRAVSHDTAGNLHVLNLVEGEAVVVESPTQGFEPFEVHYAETFIVPAAVGVYTIRPLAETKTPLATIKAYVRCG